MDWSTIASIATAVGVEFRDSKNLAQSTFEDSSDQQYRDLAMSIPVDALIGKATPDDRKMDVRGLIYNFLDLSNEQVSLRKKNRITKDAWHDWCSGI